MKFAFKLAVVAAFVTSIGAVQAQSNQQEKFYGGLEVGRSNVSDQTGEVTSALVSQLGGSAIATQGSSINDYRIFGGYKLNENVNFELGYLQTSSLDLNFSGVARGSVAYAGSAGVKFAGFDYSVLLRPDVSTGVNGLFIRLGGHSLKSTTDVSLTVSGSSITATTNQSGTGTLFGIGYDINITKNADFRVSANRLNNIAGQSDSSATVYSVGVLTKF